MNKKIKNKTIFGMLLIIMLSFFSSYCFAQYNYINGVLHLKIKQGYNVNVTNYVQGNDTIKLTGLQMLDNLNITYTCKQFRNPFPNSNDPNLSRWYVLLIDSTMNQQTILNSYSVLNEVEIAEREAISIVAGCPVNDPFYVDNNGIRMKSLLDMGMDDAWCTETGNSNVIIAVLDNGIIGHPDVSLNNIWQNYGEDANQNGYTIYYDVNGNLQFDPGDLNSFDDDANGYIDDLAGWNSASANYDMRGTPPADHGLSIFGVIAATGNNSLGGVGNAYNCKVMNILAGYSGYISGNYYEGIYYAANNGAKVINMSFFGSSSSSIYQDAISYAHNTKGCVVVAAGGYTGGYPINAYIYPAAFDKVLGASILQSNPEGIPNLMQTNVYVNDSLDVLTSPNNGCPVYRGNPPEPGWDWWVHTSGATALCSGLAGLLFSEHYNDPAWTNDRVINQILITCNNKDDYNGPESNEYNFDFRNLIGYGALRADRALTFDGNVTWNHILCKRLRVYYDLILHYGYTMRLLNNTKLYFEPDKKMYVDGELIVEGNLDINTDIIVRSGGILRFTGLGTVKLAEGKKIYVESGGNISILENYEEQAPYRIIFTTLPGNNSWGGFKLEGDANGYLGNCQIENTELPIEIDGNGMGMSPVYDVSIRYGAIYGPIQVNSRSKVLVENNYFYHITGQEYGITIIGSNNVTVRNNYFDYSSSSISTTGISVIYGSGVSIIRNSLYNVDIGINVSNSNPYISDNDIISESASHSEAGIYLDNSYSSILDENYISGYSVGFGLYYSSPTMFQNMSINTGGNGQYSVVAEYMSNPRLTPSVVEGEIIWDAGQNVLRTNSQGTSLLIQENSIPDADYGYNTFYGYQYYIDGEMSGVIKYFIRNNCWIDDPPDPDKFNLSGPSVIYNPYTCEPPGGASYSSVVTPINRILLDPPPPPIVVCYGVGICDTIEVALGGVSVGIDKALFNEAVEEELLGNYSSAITKYKYIVNTYSDSLTALNSLKKILYCTDRMNPDTSVYSALREYCLTLISSSINPDLIKIVTELSAKCYVRLKSYSSAILKYEDIIEQSNDSSEILCAELNIIETYMLIQGGDAPAFTGKLKQLKPKNIIDGLKMIGVRYRILNKGSKEHIIPKEFSLSQNYPNPFNPYTTIEYSLLKSTKVVIKVYDILGRFIKDIVNEYKDAGVHKIKFDGTNLASGVYLYKIEAGTFVDTKKMVLVK